MFVQAEDGIRDLVRSRGLGDVYKRQAGSFRTSVSPVLSPALSASGRATATESACARKRGGLLYTSDAADERSSVDLGGRGIIKKKKKKKQKKKTNMSDKEDVQGQ